MSYPFGEHRFYPRDIVNCDDFTECGSWRSTGNAAVIERAGQFRRLFLDHAASELQRDPLGPAGTGVETGPPVRAVDVGRKPDDYGPCGRLD